MPAEEIGQTMSRSAQVPTRTLDQKCYLRIGPTLLEPGWQPSFGLDLELRVGVDVGVGVIVRA